MKINVKEISYSEFLKLPGYKYSKPKRRSILLATVIRVVSGFELLKYILLPYGKEFKERIMRNLSDETAKLSEICSLNFELGYRL